MDDHQLLRRYVEEGSHEAFAELVRRHVALVHSSASRQVRDPHDAEDVTQAVFIALARSAGKIRRGQVIAGWLLTATRHLASHARRQAGRRKRREREAAEMKPTSSEEPTADVWDAIAPCLDDALEEVGDKARDAIVLRYFQGMSVRETAAALEISEDAAKQRLSRAMERLRGVFSRRGVTISAAALATALAANAVQAAPASLSATTAASAIQCANYLAMEKGALTIMAGIKTKSIIVGALALVIGGTTGVVIQQSISRDHRTVAAATPAKASSDGSWKSRFQRTYRLEKGEMVKRVAPPFIPEREAYFNEIDPQRMFDVSEEMSVATFVDNGEVEFRDWSRRRPTVAGVVAQCVGLPGYKLEMPLKDKLRPAPGDWVIRPSATEEEKMKALAKLLSQPDWKIRFEKREAEHEVVVARGRFDAPKENENGAVQLFIDGVGATKGMAAGDVNGFLSTLGDMIDTEMVDEAENPKTPVFWSNRIGSEAPADGADKLLDNVGKQTGLKFSREKRMTSRWVAVPAEAK